ncbi:MAG: hypothetical protein ACREOL_02560, partial [Candidatus Dormibacteria bacterium]
MISPTSCWQTGPTAAVVSGTDPSAPSSGTVVVISGQSQRLSTLPHSGAVRILASGTSTACGRAGDGTYYLIDLQDGQVGAVPQDDCRAGSSAQSGPAPDTGAPERGGVNSPNTFAAALPPTVSPSYYEYYAYYDGGCAQLASCALYQQGQTTLTPSQSGLVVLDFGSPCYVPDTSIYGVEMFFTPVCIPDTSVQGLVRDWIMGYESDHGSGSPPLTLAIGTSNSLNGIDPNYQLTTTQMQDSGAAWYQQLVGAISTAGLSAPLVLWGADDMEQAGDGNWYPGAPTVAWATGFSSAASPGGSKCQLSSRGYLADYGDDILGGTGSEDGWTVPQVYQVSWRLHASCALPEIYYAGMAPEWAALSQWGASNGGAIAFTGVMTE